jgi:hypothetical protein
MQPLDSSLSKQEIVDGIDVGDQIEIETKSGEHRSIYVSSISETHIESNGEHFAIEEIEIIAVRKTNAAEEVAAVGAGIAVGVLFQALIMALILGLAF